MAVRQGPWKYHRPRQRYKGGLYNLDRDLGETTDLSAKHPDVKARLQQLLLQFEQELGAGDKLSPACRPAGRVEKPVLLTTEGPRPAPVKKK